MLPKKTSGPLFWELTGAVANGSNERKLFWLSNLMWDMGWGRRNQSGISKSDISNTDAEIHITRQEAIFFYKETGAGGLETGSTQRKVGWWFTSNGSRFIAILGGWKCKLNIQTGHFQVTASTSSLLPNISVTRKGFLKHFAAMSWSSSPLEPHEIQMAGQLLLRALRHGQMAELWAPLQHALSKEDKWIPRVAWRGNMHGKLE